MNIRNKMDRRDISVNQDGSTGMMFPDHPQLMGSQAASFCQGHFSNHRHHFVRRFLVNIHTNLLKYMIDCGCSGRFADLYPERTSSHSFWGKRLVGVLILHQSAAVDTGLMGKHIRSGNWFVFGYRPSGDHCHQLTQIL